MIFFDSHMHTPLCKHATGEPEAYAATAERRGLKGIVVTCHNPGPDDDWSANVRMSMRQFDEYIATVERARAAWVGRVEVRLGLETDYIPGMEPWIAALHRKAEFEYVLGSVHPHLDHYQAAYFTDGIRSFQRTYFEHLAMAAESGLFDALAHPDVVKSVHQAEWNLSELMDDIRRSLDRIARAGVAMEVNTSAMYKGLMEISPSRAILEAMHARQIPVALGSDAHRPEEVGRGFDYALDLLRAVGYTEVYVFAARQPHAVDIAQAHASLVG